MNKVFSKISVVIAIGSGLIVLIGYFIDLPIIDSLRTRFLEWALILAGIALFIGVVNLIQVHWMKFRQHEKGSINSLVLIITMFIVILVGGYFGPTTKASLWIFNYVQIPIESSLMAILSVLLAYILARLLGRRMNFFNLVFIGVVLVTLFGEISITGLQIPGLAGFSRWINQVPAMAGARGIILGVVLGTVATGLRILYGSDRPYGGE